MPDERTSILTLTPMTAGEVVRLTKGRYGSREGASALSAARRLNGVVSHLSAAQHWQWKVRRRAPQPAVTVPLRRKVDAARSSGIDVHRADLTADDVAGEVTGRVRTVLDCARDLTFDQALSAADSALREGRVTRDDVPGARRRAQVGVGNAYLIGRADLVDLRLAIVAEAESWAHHGLREAFDHDIRRYTAMVRAGFLVVRFTYGDVMHRPAYVHDVLADLGACAHSGECCHGDVSPTGSGACRSRLPS